MPLSEEMLPVTLCDITKGNRVAKNDAENALNGQELLLILNTFDLA